MVGFVGGWVNQNYIWVFRVNTTSMLLLLALCWTWSKLDMKSCDIREQVSLMSTCLSARRLQEQQSTRVHQRCSTRIFQLSSDCTSDVCSMLVMEQQLLTPKIILQPLTHFLEREWKLSGVCVRAWACMHVCICGWGCVIVCECVCVSTFVCEYVCECVCVHMNQNQKYVCVFAVTISLLKRNRRMNSVIMNTWNVQWPREWCSVECNTAFKCVHCQITFTHLWSIQLKISRMWYDLYYSI